MIQRYFGRSLKFGLKNEPAEILDLSVLLPFLISKDKRPSPSGRRQHVRIKTVSAPQTTSEIPVASSGSQCGPRCQGRISPSSKVAKRHALRRGLLFIGNQCHV